MKILEASAKLRAKTHAIFDDNEDYTLLRKVLDCAFPEDEEGKNYEFFKFNYYGYSRKEKGNWGDTGIYLEELKLINLSEIEEEDKKIPPIKSDPIVNSIIEQFKQRSELGIKKYGTTLHENNTDDFLQHFKEELMDAILYIQKLQTQ